MYTVLVVDDEKVIREGCCRILSAKGHRVLSAASGRTALDLLASEPVNAILCGLKMPGMDALEVLEEVRGSSPRDSDDYYHRRRHRGKCHQVHEKRGL